MANTLLWNKGEFNLSEDRIIVNIPINDIAPNPYQPRRVFVNSAIEELAASISQYGVLQPINVRRLGESKYELIAGERRLRAAKLAGLLDIPAIVIEVMEQDSAVIALIENLQREDLNFMEEAEGYYNLINDHGFTQEELAKKVGKNQSTIANKLRILKLSDRVKKVIIENNLTERHARALLKLPEEAMQIKVLKTIVEKALNVKKTEELIEKMLSKLTDKKNKEKHRNIRGKINYKIYVNTIKNTYRDILKTGFKMEYDQVDKGDFVEITLRVPKNVDI